MKKTYYEKQGRRYVPVAEYDNDWMDSFPEGNHLIMCYPGGVSRRYRIEPALAPMIAAGRLAMEVITDRVYQASEVRPSREIMTDEERAAWNHLIEVWGDSARTITRPCARAAAEAGVHAMSEQAEKLLNNPAVREAYDHFMFIAKLTYEAENKK